MNSLICPMDDDWQLLDDYATRNSEEAFRTLVDRYAGMVYHAALRQAGNPHTAEEVTQAVFIALAQKAGKIPRQTILYGWLFRAARFALLNFMRDEACRRRHEQEATTMEHIIRDDDNESVWEQISPHLDDALDRLSEADREVVMIRFFGSKSHKEMAQALGVTEVTAKKRLSRAVEKLRRVFARRGVVVPAVALVASLTAYGAQAAPAGVASSAAAVALAKGTAGAASTVAIANTILRLMAWAKAKMAIALGAGVLLAAGTATVVMETTNGADGSVISKLEKQTGKTIIADKHLALPATLDIKNAPLQQALDKLAVDASAYWSVDYAIYDSDQSLRQLLDLLREGTELQTGGWTNLSAQFRQADMSVQSFDPHGRSRAILRMANGDASNQVGMVVVLGPNAAVKMPGGGPMIIRHAGSGDDQPPPQGGPIIVRHGDGGDEEGPPPGSPFQIIRDAIRDGVNEGVLAPERLLAPSQLISKMALATPLPATAESAERIAKLAHARWTIIYTLRKSPISGAGIKLVHAGMPNYAPPAGMSPGHEDMMQNLQANRFNLSPEDRAAHERAVQAYKNQKQ